MIAAWLAVQPLSILVSPSNPWAAKRLGAASRLAWTASPSTVDHLVKSAQACPAKQAYSGTPYIAFLAGRRVPGDQADTFMIEHASANAASARRAAADTPTCPAPALSETDATSAPG